MKNHRAWAFVMRVPWWMWILLVVLVSLGTQLYTPWRGVITLTWMGALWMALFLTHITIAYVTIYLHRNQTHHAIDLHPAISHPFRFWGWLTTGMVTKEWVAIHRKHHAKVETDEDPHSPKVYGIKRVLWGGVLLYVKESHHPDTILRYGAGTPEDWLERNIYTPHQKLGVVLLLITQFILFGPLIGIAIWLTQMVWIPFLAAGVINGAGHYYGYRNFPSRNEKTKEEDWSTNIVPWGMLIGGEELHNNHHWYPQSAKFSAKWYEFDLGWLYIRILETLGLAKAKFYFVDGKKHNER